MENILQKKITLLCFHRFEIDPFFCKNFYNICIEIVHDLMTKLFFSNLIKKKSNGSYSKQIQKPVKKN